MGLDCTVVGQYLHDYIPFSKAMAVSVDSIDEGCVVFAVFVLVTSS